MTLSEAQTRKEIIDKRLAKAGWNVKNPSMVTEELDIISDINKAADPQDKYSGIKQKTINPIRNIEIVEVVK